MAYYTDSQILAALDAAGVDNWDGYDHALEILRAQEPEGH